MPNRQLSKEELRKADELLGWITEKIKELSDGDPDLLFAYQRRLWTRLQYAERGKPMQRRLLKAQKLVLQNYKCANPKCQKDLRSGQPELHRFQAPLGYTLENTELLCRECHRAQQAAQRFA